MNQDANDDIINLGRDVAMQVAAMNPLALDESDIAPGSYR